MSVTLLVRCVRPILCAATLLAVTGIVPLFADSPSEATSGEKSPREIFRERILPIFRSPDPSSCVECHLSAVDLKNYIQPDHEKTFLSLRDQGMVDLEAPGESKILELIQMRPEERSGKVTIHERNRRAEFEAFREWIVASSRDERLRKAPPLEPAERAQPRRSDEVIRHNRIDRVVDSFARNVWALRFRCAGCHMQGGAKFAKHTEKHGEKMGWLSQRGPRETLRRIVERELIDMEEPERSLLLLKPLDEVEHGGGIKMAEGDTDYLAFLSWIRDYAKVIDDDYATSDELPAPSRRTGSEIWLRVEGLPESWLKQRGVLTVYAQRGDAVDSGWAAEPVAVASFNVRQNRRFGVFAQGFLMIESRVRDAPRLPAGRYQIRVHLGEAPAGETDLDAIVASSREVGRAVVRSPWKRGFRHATVVKLPRVAF